MADRLIRVSRYWQMQPENRRDHWDNGLQGLDLGDELLQLRGCLDTTRGALAIERDRYLNHLAMLLRSGGPTTLRHDQLDGPTRSLLQALATAPNLPETSREMAHAALMQLQATWRRWCRQQAQAPRPEAEQAAA